jgi:hypothetical protein
VVGASLARRTGTLLAMAVLLAVPLSGCSTESGSADSGTGPGAGVGTGGAAGDTNSACPAPARPDPEWLACQLRTTDAVLHDPGAGATALVEAGQRSEDGYRLLGDHPEWDGPVLTTLPPGLREQARRAVDAHRALVDLDGPPPATLPAWRVVEPVPADQLRGYYTDAQRRFGVPWTLLAAVHLVETRMSRVVGVSTAGALGPMQFMPGTWARYGLGGNVWDTRDAIMGAAHYLAANGATSPAGLDRALLRYNNDVRYVRAVRNYAAMLDADPRAFLELHAWPVRFRTVAGDIALDPGYATDRRIPVAEWLATHPTAPLTR